MLGISSSFYRIESPLSNSFSVLFDGTNDYVDCSDSVANDVKLTGSVSVWAKLTTGASNDMIFALATDSSNDNKINVFHSTSNDELRIQYRGNSTNTLIGYSIAEAALISAGWVHIVATWDQTAPELSLYYNGVHVANGTEAITAFATTANRIYLGKATNANSTYWAGNLDEYALYSRVLDAAEAKSLYNNGTPVDLTEGHTNGLLQWLRFEEDSGTMADSSGNGRTGTASGATQGSDEIPTK